MSRSIRTLDQLPPRHREEALRQLQAQEAKTAPIHAPGALNLMVQAQSAANGIPAKAPKRIRQDGKPLMNQLETEWFDHLTAEYPNWRIRPQAMRFRLGNGLWFKVDFTAADVLTAWEVKGPHAFRGGFENLKMAAATYREWKWILVWKQDGQWQEQEVLP